MATIILRQANVIESFGGVIKGSPLTNAEVDNNFANLNVQINNVANIISTSLTTSNIAEGANLYFTNARVLSAVTNANILLHDLTVVGNFIASGNTVFLNTQELNIVDPIVHLAGGNPDDAFDIGIIGHYKDANLVQRHTGFFRDHEDKKFYLFDNYDTEPTGNIGIDVNDPSFRLVTVAANTFEGAYLTGNLDYSFITNKPNTTAVPEGNNLYFTNTRAFAAVANIINTSQVTEGANLYFTNARSVAALTAGFGIDLNSNGLIAANTTNLGINIVSYDDRNNLRTGTPLDNNQVLVEGLGLFVFQLGATDIDDDESCFATSNGRWILQSPSMDVVEATILPRESVQMEKIRNLETFNTAHTARFIFANVESTIISVASVAQASFFASVPGAETRDAVLVTPPSNLTSRLSIFANVLEAGNVVVYLSNPSAAVSGNFANGFYKIVVIKEIYA